MTDLRLEPVTAVVLAGGVGERFGGRLPKQLMRVAGKSSLEHTIELFERHPRVTDIIVMMNPDYVAEAEQIVATAGFTKVSAIHPGGITRNETSQLALADLPGDRKVLFHDAVRPLLDDTIIDACIDALENFDAVDVAIASADTLIEVDESNTIQSFPARARHRRGQTPQAFRVATLKAAYARANDDPAFFATDDCGVVFKYLPEIPIFVVPGADENIKITEQVDLHIADKLFQLKSGELSAGSYDPRALAGKRIIVVGGSSGIGEAIVQLASEAGAHVVSLSRSETTTHIENAEAVEASITDAAHQLGGIDAIFVTAGILHKAELTEFTPAQIESSIMVNLAGPAIVAHAAFEFLKATGGSLVLFTSSSYTRGRAGYSLYSAAKAGVVNLTQALAEEWQSHGVSVTCINPQRTATPMRFDAFGDEDPTTLLDPVDVAKVALVATGSDYSGQVIDVRLGEIA